MCGLVVLCFWFFDLEACGILPPQPGIKSTPPALEAQSLNLWIREVSNTLPSYCQNMSRRREEVKEGIWISEGG